jgi:hypothetical protein
MSEIKDKVLGVKTKKARIVPLANVLTADCVWKVTKQGCGTSVFDGLMVAQMLDRADKAKILSGQTHLTSGLYEFELCKGKNR